MRIARKFALVAFAVLCLTRFSHAYSPRNALAFELSILAEVMWQYQEIHQHFPTEDICDSQGKPLLSWRVRLLEYMDRHLYKEFKLDEPWDSPHNQQMIEKIPDCYRITFHPAGFKTRMVALRGANTFFGIGQPRRKDDIQNDLATTVMVVEADDDHAPIWTKPEDLQYDPAAPARGLGKDWTAGFQREKAGFAVMADKRIRSLPTSVAADTLRRLFSIEASEPVEHELRWYQVLDMPPLDAMLGGALVIGLTYVLAGLVIAYRMVRRKPLSPGELLIFIIAAHQLVFLPAFLLQYRFDLLPQFYEVGKDAFQFYAVGLPSVAALIATVIAFRWRKKANASPAIFAVIIAILSVYCLDAIQPYQFWFSEDALARIGPPFAFATATVLVAMSSINYWPQGRIGWHLMGLIGGLIPLVWYLAWKQLGYVDPQEFLMRMLA